MLYSKLNSLHITLYVVTMASLRCKNFLSLDSDSGAATGVGMLCHECKEKMGFEWFVCTLVETASICGPGLALCRVSFAFVVKSSPKPAFVRRVWHRFNRSFERFNLYFTCNIL